VTVTLKRERDALFSAEHLTPTLPDQDTSTRLLPLRRNIQDSF
jgi:hypothetical protein